MFNARIYHTRAKEIRVTLIQVNKPLMFCIVSYWELAADGRTKNTQKLLTQRIPGWVQRCEVFWQTLPTPARRLGIAVLGGLAKHFRLHLEDEGVPHEGAPQRSLNWLLRDRVVTDLGTWLGESLYLVILRDHPRSKGGKYWRHV